MFISLNRKIKNGLKVTIQHNVLFEGEAKTKQFWSVAITRCGAVWGMRCVAQHALCTQPCYSLDGFRMRGIVYI